MMLVKSKNQQLSESYFNLGSGLSSIAGFLCTSNVPFMYDFELSAINFSNVFLFFPSQPLLFTTFLGCAWRVGGVTHLNIPF